MEALSSLFINNVHIFVVVQPDSETSQNPPLEIHRKVKNMVDIQQSWQQIINEIKPIKTIMAIF